LGTKDPRVDAYIEKANPFARPILKRLRKWAHQYCPECEETLKWSAPHFSYKGRMYCGMSAFKEHCAFGFWHPLMRRDDNSLRGQPPRGQDSTSMGSFGKIRSVADLPAEGEFARMAREAMKLTDENVKAPPRPKAAKKPLVVPAALKAALAKNKKAAATFDAFSYSHRREYVEWVAEAKRDETRDARVKQAVAWLAAGKPRHWKYVR
jgi:uncharacterized protein YdeI (YjbR/CyaY-like superfamily)